jgi:hypothetical protein
MVSVIMVRCVMSRYIDADALKVNMRGAFIDHIEEFRAITIVDDAPSIDIVFCKECKHWRNTDAEKIPTASIACGNMHADDFCSYGEREGE